MNNIRVLAVDDAVANLMILKGVLKGNEFKVVTSTNALEALQLFKQEFFDVVLLDVIMPGIDGFELRKLDIILIFAALNWCSVNIYRFAARNNQYIQLIVWTTQFIRPLVAFLTSKLTGGKLTTHQSTSGKKMRFGIVIS